MIDPKQLAARIADQIRPAVAAELEASRARILERLGPIERIAARSAWGAIEDEVPHIVEASLAEILGWLNALTVPEALAAILDRQATPSPNPWQ